MAVLAAALFAGPLFVLDLRRAIGGSYAALAQAPSDLGDMLSLPIVAPVALTAIAVRDGTLRWPWALLSSSLLAWLMYDALWGLPDYLGVQPTSLRLVSEQFHVLAGLLACAAGLAQRKAVSDDEDDEP